MNRKYLIPLFLIAVFVVLGIFLPAWMRYLLTVALCKAFAVFGIVLLMRAGFVTFGNALYFSAGAYAVAFTHNLWGIREAFILIIIGVIVSLVFAMAVGILVSRYREIFFAMITLAVSMAFFGILVKAYGITGGTDGLHIAPPTIFGFRFTSAGLNMANYFLVLFFLIIVAYLLYRFINSPFGYILSAIKENEIRVAYLGGSVQKTVYLTFLIAGGLAGLGGSLITFSLGHIDPYLSYWTMSSEFVFVALMSGIGNVFASIFGAALIEFVRTYAFKYSPYTWQMVLGGMMLIIILFSPGGLWAIYQNITGRWKKRLELRGKKEHDTVA